MAHRGRRRRSLNEESARTKGRATGYRITRKAHSRSECPFTLAVWISRDVRPSGEALTGGELTRIHAVGPGAGELLAEQTVPAGAKGSAVLLRWARGLGEGSWALEDCRHVSGSPERFLIEHGERVLRVHSKLMSASRREPRGRGKSDSIDALSVARAAPRRPRRARGSALGRA
jgi:Transposase